VSIEAGPERPEISVVIASVNGLPYPLGCLEALSHQEGGITFEVIVADCTGPSTVAAIHDEHPTVRVLAHDEPRSVPWLRAAGIGAARGRLVAVTEDHCRPRSNWLSAMIAVHDRTGWAAIGGGVENGSPERLVDWAVYFCEYHSLMSPVPAGPSNALPGMNVVYDMDQLGELRALFDEGLWENFLHDRLVDRGHTLGLDPSIIVDHCKYFTVAMFCRERYHYSRAFAGSRVEGASLARRCAWAAATPLLPPLLMTRIARAVVSRRRHVWWLVKSLPLIALFSSVWAFGELVGYLRGPGDSLVRIR
jgi:Glycosyl transferase family 2